MALNVDTVDDSRHRYLTPLKPDPPIFLSAGPTANSSDSAATKIDSKPESDYLPWYAFRLRSAILFMVILEVSIVAVTLTTLNYISQRSSNADAIAQGTSGIVALATQLQRGASKEIRTSMDSYLKKLTVLANNTANLVHYGVVDVTDYDTLVPLMKASYIGANVTAVAIFFWMNSTLESIGVGPVTPALYGNLSYYNITYDPSVPLFQVQYYATNKTCARFCPVVSTNARQTSWLYNTTTDSATTLLSTSAAAFKAWTRPWYVDRLPHGQISISPPYTAISRPGNPPRVFQALVFSLWTKNGTFIGEGPINYGTRDLCGVLETLKASTTPNSFYYIMTPKAEVLAMTGVGEDQTPLMHFSNTSGWLLNTIWDYSATDFPLLNVSAATIYSYSGNNLSNNFADAEFTVGDYMFQVTSYTYVNYKWIIVSGAPSSDYLGETLALQTSLADRLWNVQKMIIIIAAVIVVTMSAISVMFTELLISKPLSFILEVIGMASRFDFSVIRQGELQQRKSVIAEVYVLQDRFMSMLHTFADALQKNKSLLGKVKSSSFNGESSKTKDGASTSVNKPAGTLLPKVEESAVME
ncbi:hypothetical protein HDU93_006013 [Gonapodya sp. JEL0774]|nr:hypothetical protein HDU93_006013 [Gonapodya sp. JEL0774]